VQELGLELCKCLTSPYSKTIVVVFSVAYSVQVNVDSSQILDHLLGAGETH
jgi:hypothetical protein